METNAKDIVGTGIYIDWQGKVVFTPYESGMYSICVSLTRPLPDEFWEYGNPLVGSSSCFHFQRFYFEVEHGIQHLNTTKLAKIEDMTEIDATVNSLVKVLKEMTQEMEYQNVFDELLW